MDDRVEQTIAWLEQHLNTTITLPTLAERAGLSVAQFTRLFRQRTGITPGAYLHRARMMRARVLLERTSLSVADIMRQVGVSDPSHFARDFRRAHGLSPRFLRQQLRTQYALRGRSRAPDVACAGTDAEGDQLVGISTTQSGHVRTRRRK